MERFFFKLYILIRIFSSRHLLLINLHPNHGRERIDLKMVSNVQGKPERIVILEGMIKCLESELKLAEQQKLGILRAKMNQCQSPPASTTESATSAAHP